MNGDYQRKSDLELTTLSQKFSDFVERYDRDCRANNKWQEIVDKTLEKHGEILSEISPAYAKGKIIAGLVAVGSVGLAVRAFWSHIRWQ